MRTMQSETQWLVLQAKDTSTVKIRCRKDDGPISGQAITDRMVAICGCHGKFDCECMSIENQARRELWTEHNSDTPHPLKGMGFCC